MLKLKIMNENIPLRKNNFIINNSQNPNLLIASNLNLINDVPRNNFSILNNRRKKLQLNENIDKSNNYKRKLEINKYLGKFPLIVVGPYCKYSNILIIYYRSTSILYIFSFYYIPIINSILNS